MAKNKPSNSKVESLRLRGSLNRHPEKVADPLFAASDFFDPRDLVQVKYEMMRKVQIDRQTISGSVASFGFTRPSFYQAQARIKRGGLPALIPQKPGPRRRHKLSAEVMAFIQELRSEDASLRPPDLVHRIMARFGLKVHVRSVERALLRQEKNGLNRRALELIG